MNIISTALGVLKPLTRIFSKMTTDKDKVLEAQAELRKLELQDAPVSYLRLWMGFLGWALAAYVVVALIVRPLIVFYFPNVPVPEMPLDDVLTLLMGMMGIAL